MDIVAQNSIVELIQAGRAESALLVLNRHLHKEPNDWYALYMSGVALRALGRLDDAITYLAKAVSVNADEAPVHLALGIALQLSGRLDDAVRSLLAAIQLRPDLYEAYNSLGITYKKLGRHKEALNTYEQGIDRLMASVSKIVHSDPTRCYREEIVDGERIRTVLPYVFMKTREMLRANPLYAILTNNVAVCFAELGQINEAQRLYEEAIEFTPDGYNYPDPHQHLQRLTGNTK
ncbi:tetratricopeptide repeat protein [Sulfuritalea hydrogenivorans]|nr:tetratricopeptide repeat protein [Sulfuritalea hydrogenivorans]